MTRFFESSERDDWRELMRAIDAAPTTIPCENWPDAYFVTWQEDPDGFKLAKASCNVCPVKQDCGSYGMKWAEYGIWGGMTALERKYARRKLPLTPKRVA